MGGLRWTVKSNKEIIKELCSWTATSLSYASSNARDRRTQVWCIKGLANGVLEFLPRYSGRHKLAKGIEVGRCLWTQGDVKLAFDRGRRRERHG